MSTRLITHSPDLKRLQDDGYELQIIDSHVIIHNVPYLASNQKRAYGILVAPIDSVSGDIAQPPAAHTVFFAGRHPHGSDGSPLATPSISLDKRFIVPGLEINFQFSAKPSAGYRDYHHKMKTYIQMLKTPLVELGINADGRTFRRYRSRDNSPFIFGDTNSARSGMTAINNKVAGLKIAIIGLGGTGSYVLDYVAKTPVKEIHLYDGDTLLSHNAFRAPGSPTKATVQKALQKTSYHAKTYSRMHRGIKAFPVPIDSSNIDRLAGYDFIFLCLDNSQVKQQILDALVARQIPFVDTGIGVRALNESLAGIIRTTVVTEATREKLSDYLPAFTPNAEEDVYRSNAQIAELNALNASMAVIAWKRHYGIYPVLKGPDHNIYNLRNGRMAIYEN